MGERCIRIAEVEGSTPFRSTKFSDSLSGVEQGNPKDRNSPGDCFGARGRAVERRSETGDSLQVHHKTLQIKKQAKQNFDLKCVWTWGISAAGSAQHWQCWGQGFKSPMLHQKDRTPFGCSVFFCNDELSFSISLDLRDGVLFYNERVGGFFNHPRVVFGRVGIKILNRSIAVLFLVCLYFVFAYVNKKYLARFSVNP